MKTLLSAVAVSAALATAASAGSPVTVITPAPVVVAPAAAATDWSGFYLGGTYSAYSANQTFQGDIEDSTYGGFAGYNFQRGSMVFGAELELGMGDYDEGAYSGEVGVADLKARAGYSFGSALVYGFAGASSIAVDTSGISVDFTGYNYGVGGAYQFDSGLFVGLEYIARDLAGNGLADGEDLTTSGAAIRVGWQF